MLGRPRISLIGLAGRGRTPERLGQRAEGVGPRRGLRRAARPPADPSARPPPTAPRPGRRRTQPPGRSSSRSRPRSISSAQRPRGRRGRRLSRGSSAGSTPGATTSRKIVPAAPLQQRASLRAPGSHVHATHHVMKAQDPHPEGAGPGVTVASGSAQAPRRALRPSSSVQSTAGSWSPNFSNHSVICGISGLPLLDVDVRAPASRSSLGHVEAVDVERARRGDVADGGLDRGGLALDALDDPLQHAAVLAEARATGSHRRRRGGTS